MKKIMVMAMAMVLSLPVAALAFGFGGNDPEGNNLSIEQYGAYNTAGVMQDIASYGRDVSNNAEIYQCGLLNSIYVDQKATWHSNSYKTTQVGFGNTFSVYQR